MYVTGSGCSSCMHTVARAITEPDIESLPIHKHNDNLCQLVIQLMYPSNEKC